MFIQYVTLNHRLHNPCTPSCMIFNTHSTKQEETRFPLLPSSKHAHKTVLSISELCSLISRYLSIIMWSDSLVRMDPSGRYFTPCEPPCFVSGPKSSQSSLPSTQSRSLSQSFSPEQCQVFGAIYESSRETTNLIDPLESRLDEVRAFKEVSGLGIANGDSNGNNSGVNAVPTQVSEKPPDNASINESAGGEPEPDIGNSSESIVQSSLGSKARDSLKLTDGGFPKHASRLTNTSLSFPPYRGKRLGQSGSSHPRMGFPWSQAPSTHRRDGGSRPFSFDNLGVCAEIPRSGFPKVGAGTNHNFVSHLPDSDIFGPGGLIRCPKTEEFRPRFDPDFGYVDGFAWNSPRIPSQSFGAYGHPTEANLSALGYIPRTKTDARMGSFASTAPSFESEKVDMRTNTSPSSVGMDFPFNPRPKRE